MWEIEHYTIQGEKMKKYTLCFVLLALVCGACSASAEASNPPAEEVSTAVVGEVEAIEEEEIDMNDPNVVLELTFNEPAILFSEDVAAMEENTGGQFGFVPIKRANSEEGVFEFGSDAEGAWFPLNTLLDEFGGGTQQGCAQAVLAHFQPPTAVESLQFFFFGQNEFGVNFQEGGRPSVIWVVEAYGEQFDGDLTLEEGKTYYFLMALDETGDFAARIWEDGNPDNQAVFRQDLSQRANGEGYQHQSWKWDIGFAENDTLKMLDYTVFTFESIK